jgi:hypothetical protein
VLSADFSIWVNLLGYYLDDAFYPRLICLKGHHFGILADF